MEKHTPRKAKSSETGLSAHTRRRGGRNGAASHIPLLEWIVAALGLALVVSTAVFLGSQGYANRSSPPEISVHVDSVVQLRNGYLVTVRGVNTGGTTGASVKVVGELVSPSGVAERREMSFQYLPPDSVRTGGLFFTEDPRKFKVILRPEGYEAP